MLSPLLLIAHHNGLLDASLLDPCPALIGVHHLEHYNDVWDTNDFDDNDNDDGDDDDDDDDNHDDDDEDDRRTRLRSCSLSWE